MTEKGKQDSESHIEPKWELEIPAVVDGRIVPIEELGDQIFALKMIGDGYGIYPTSEVVYAPCDCKIETMASTRHAVYLSLPGKIKVLIHIGMDTIDLKGEGFTSDLESGMWVGKGEPLVKFDSKMLEEKGYNPVIAVIVLDYVDKNLELSVFPMDAAKANETTAMVVSKRQN